MKNYKGPTSNLKRMLKERGFSIEEFASLSGTQESVIEKIVNGGYTYTPPNTIAKILIVLECEFFDLFPKKQFEVSRYSHRERKLKASEVKIKQLENQMIEMQDFMLKQAAIIDKLSNKN